jgi:hypothetical protein
MQSSQPSSRRSGTPVDAEGLGEEKPPWSKAPFRRLDDTGGEQSEDFSTTSDILSLVLGWCIVGISATIAMYLPKTLDPDERSHSLSSASRLFYSAYNRYLA